MLFLIVGVCGVFFVVGVALSVGMWVMLGGKQDSQQTGDGSVAASNGVEVDTRARAERLAAIAAAERAADAMPIGDLWDGYLSDAAGAQARFGDRPRVKMVAERIEKSAGGFTVIRELEAGGMVRLLFSDQEGRKLAGKTGEVIRLRGRVMTATPRLLMMSQCELE